jgi:hypothetical protein
VASGGPLLCTTDFPVRRAAVSGLLLRTTDFPVRRAAVSGLLLRTTDFPVRRAVVSGLLLRTTDFPVRRAVVSGLLLRTTDFPVRRAAVSGLLLRTTDFLVRRSSGQCVVRADNWKHTRRNEYPVLSFHECCDGLGSPSYPEIRNGQRTSGVHRDPYDGLPSPSSSGQCVARADNWKHTWRNE